MVDPDGWFHTGYRGKFDAAGSASFVGRMDEKIKVGGENVARANVEPFLHPSGIHLAQVVGVPDDRPSQLPAAFVELKPSAQVSPRRGSRPTAADGSLTFPGAGCRRWMTAGRGNG
jgi:acyl-CoA synthetase (AMP-forming)/AMP-acid ligase II